MKTLSAIVILLILYVPARQCMSQTGGGDSAGTSAEHVVEVELISFGKQGLRVRSAAGEEELFPLDDLQAYRLVNGKLEVKHISGRVMVLPAEALGDSTALKEGRWHILSPGGMDAQYARVEVVDRDDEEICLRTLDGEHEYELSELMAYRVKNGKVQIRIESGVVLVVSQEIAGKAGATTSGKWRNISGDDSARRKTLFPGITRSQEVASSMEKEIEEVFGDIPMSLIALGLACLVVNVAFVICFGLVICAMFLNGEITSGLVCIALTCVMGGGPLIGLYYGWTNCQAWRIQKLMVVWSILWVIGIALNIVMWATLPDLLMQMDPKFAGCQA